MCSPTLEKTPAQQLNEIKKSIARYHIALDERAHGGQAERKAFEEICSELDMHWEQGEGQSQLAALTLETNNPR
jgi:hypothetical protein